MACGEFHQRRATDPSVQAIKADIDSITEPRRRGDKDIIKPEFIQDVDMRVSTYCDTSVVTGVGEPEREIPAACMVKWRFDLRTSSFGATGVGNSFYATARL